MPSVTQLKALRLAAPSGFLRRLPGGYWVGSDVEWRRHGASAPIVDRVGTQTVMACHSRGWLLVDGYRAQLTPDGAAVLAAEHS